MIRISTIEIRGTVEGRRFGGSFSFDPGLQVISAENHFGKSLAVVSVAWCLGLEPMFGLKDNDTSRFPLAVREVIDLDGVNDIPVLSSEAILSIEKDDGAIIVIQREIIGDPSIVTVLERNSDGTEKITKLNIRKQTMKDDTGGFQNFLFSWIGIPRQKVVTREGALSEVYFENIAPLFFIDQSEGWSDLQALQIFRYRQLDIQQVAVEYLLGATEALESRIKQQTANTREDRQKGKAENIAEKVKLFFNRQGWNYCPSTHGSVSSIASRWSECHLVQIIKDEFNFDFGVELSSIHARTESLRGHLVTSSTDPNFSTAASEASQKVVEIKTKRHALREELRTARIQKGEQEALAANLHQRIRSAQDVLRYKECGIGRFDEIECPSCHRSVEPGSFGLNQHSLETVQTHILALQRDEHLVRGNLTHLQALAIRLAVEIDGLEEEYRSSNRVLTAVNSASGEEREFLAKIATELAGSERDLEHVSSAFDEARTLQAEMSEWVQIIRQNNTFVHNLGDLADKIQIFERNLQRELIALGHTAIPLSKEALIKLDDDYIPYLGPRRVRSLGSASDHPRLVSAYALSLAASSKDTKGAHPGFVLLDEPLQQNPDDKHKDLFFKYLEGTCLEKSLPQTLIFTWIKDEEISRLQKAGVNVKTPAGIHFLKYIGLDPIQGSGAALPGGALPEPLGDRSGGCLPGQPPGGPLPKLPCPQPGDTPLPGPPHGSPDAGHPPVQD